MSKKTINVLAILSDVFWCSCGAGPFDCHASLAAHWASCSGRRK